MRAPKSIHCEPCVAAVEEAVIKLLYPYLVQFITLDLYESIKATTHQPKRLPKRFGSSTLVTMLLRATKSNKSNILVLQSVASYHIPYLLVSKERI